jgi:hypothetical protein
VPAMQWRARVRATVRSISAATRTAGRVSGQAPCRTASGGHPPECAERNRAERASLVASSARVVQDPMLAIYAVRSPEGAE